MSSSSRALGVLLGLRIQPEVSLPPRRMSIATPVPLLHSHAYVHFHLYKNHIRLSARWGEKEPFCRKRTISSRTNCPQAPQ